MLQKPLSSIRCFLPAGTIDPFLAAFSGLIHAVSGWRNTWSICFDSNRYVTPPDPALLTPSHPLPGGWVRLALPIIHLQPLRLHEYIAFESMYSLPQVDATVMLYTKQQLDLLMEDIAHWKSKHRLTELETMVNEVLEVLYFDDFDRLGKVKALVFLEESVKPTDSVFKNLLDAYETGQRFYQRYILIAARVSANFHLAFLEGAKYIQHDQIVLQAALQEIAYPIQRWLSRPSLLLNKMTKLVWFAAVGHHGPTISIPFRKLTKPKHYPACPHAAKSTSPFYNTAIPKYPIFFKGKAPRLKDHNTRETSSEWEEGAQPRREDSLDRDWTGDDDEEDDVNEEKGPGDEGQGNGRDDDGEEEREDDDGEDEDGDDGEGHEEEEGGGGEKRQEGHRPKRARKQKKKCPRGSNGKVWKPVVRATPRGAQGNS
ncbi:hypothetical protein ONZ45_g10289 [Pleurotus djamor]|nr:hypothetical protein ONZ45_g10289 [Pleurotus djamor]